MGTLSPPLGWRGVRSVWEDVGPLGEGLSQQQQHPLQKAWRGGGVPSRKRPEVGPPILQEGPLPPCPLSSLCWEAQEGSSQEGPAAEGQVESACLNLCHRCGWFSLVSQPSHWPGGRRMPLRGATVGSPSLAVAGRKGHPSGSAACPSPNPPAAACPPPQPSWLLLFSLHKGGVLPSCSCMDATRGGSGCQLCSEASRGLGGGRGTVCGAPAPSAGPAVWGLPANGSASPSG